MNLLSDIITYIRRIVKTPSNSSLSDNLIIDYVNRFWLMDVDARMQLFDFKTKYQFETIPGICDYNMPLYSAQTEPGGQIISPFPVYQGFLQPCFANGIQIPFYSETNSFWKIWPSYIQSLPQVTTGDGVTQTFQFTLPYFPAIPGHIDMTGIISTGSTTDPIFGTSLATIPSTSVKPGVFITYTNANGSNTVVTDSGQFLSTGTEGDLYGLLLQPGNPPTGDLALAGGYSTTVNTVNYNTGVVNVTLPTVPAADIPIQAQCYFFEQGIPRAILFYNNTLTIRPPPDIQYLIELETYLTPAAMLATTSAIPFAYMAEYIARGAARKILSDTGDWEQFTAYEPLFIEQERLVWKRSQRIWTSTRTGTIFSELSGPNISNTSSQGAT